jgi:hypothetical protein
MGNLKSFIKHHTLIALILFIFYLLLMLWSFRSLPLFRNSILSTKGLSVLFMLKLTFSIGLVLIYTYYYTDRSYADIYKYFDDGNTIYQSIYTHPVATLKVITGIKVDHSDPDIMSVLANTHHFDKKDGGLLESNHKLIIRFNAIMRFFSHGSIFINSLFFCFLSFIGSVALFRALSLFFDKNSNKILVIPVFLVPSILFWSSGLLKETLVIFFLGILLYTAIKLFQMKNVVINLILSALSLHFLYLSKPFIAFSFLISFYVMGTFYFKGYLRVISVLIAAMAVLWFFYAHDTFICEIMHSIISKRNEFVALGLKMKAGSLIDESILSGSCMTPLRLVPTGFYNMFMQPFVWSHGLFEKIFGFENMIVLMLTILTGFFFQKPLRSKLQLAVFCMVFFLLNYALIGITVPIIGALVRYKIFGLLFYVVLLCSFVNIDKIISVINSIDYLSLLSIWANKLLFRQGK